MSRTELLQNILAATTKKLLQRDPPQHALHTNEDFGITPLSLNSIMLRFQAKLARHQVPPSMRRQAVSRAVELASVYQNSFAALCQRQKYVDEEDVPLLTKSIESTRKTIEHLYEHEHLDSFLKLAIDCHLRFRDQERQSTPGRETRPFNHKFTSCLEGYFEQNAFPSAADRKLLAAKGDMTPRQIEVWFQNHRNRAKTQGIPLNRLSASQSVNDDLIRSITEGFRGSPDSCSPGESDDGLANDDFLLDLDDLARSARKTITRTFEARAIEQCTVDSEAFGFPATNRHRLDRPVADIDALQDVFGDINIRSLPPSKAGVSNANASKCKVKASSTATTSKATPFKATLRSCFSAAVTLTCPQSHPALIRQKKKRTPSPSSKSTIMEQKRVPVQPYTLPAALPTWELPLSPQLQPIPVPSRKKPTIPYHGGKTHPGSPYPKQTVSRMSSSSSLASMDSTDSQDSQSSSRTASSIFSSSTDDSLFSETHTPSSLSPSPVTAELIDDDRFPDDLFGDYFLYQQEPSDFDLFVEDAFDRNVSMSLSDFTTTTLPDFTYFES